MTIPFRKLFLALLTVTTLALPIVGIAQSAGSEPSVATTAATENPMTGFERLVGGEWDISILSHRFQWGIGHHTVLAKSYDKAGNLAAEARWFWHPGEQTIKGYSIDASGGSFAEMTTRFEGDTLINTLETITPEGTAAYTGRWVFTDSDHYDWTLFAIGPDGEEKEMMTATATREAGTK